MSELSNFTSEHNIEPYSKSSQYASFDNFSSSNEIITDLFGEYVDKLNVEQNTKEFIDNTNECKEPKIGKWFQTKIEPDNVEKDFYNGNNLNGLSVDESLKKWNYLVQSLKEEEEDQISER
jgi:hypothetical protein